MQDRQARTWLRKGKTRIGGKAATALPDLFTIHPQDNAQNGELLTLDKGFWYVDSHDPDSWKFGMANLQSSAAHFELVQETMENSAWLRPPRRATRRLDRHLCQEAHRHDQSQMDAA